jgi:hypothetical protein
MISRSMRFASLSALLAIGVPGASADDCNALIALYAGQLAKAPSSVVTATVTTNQGDRHFASATFAVRLKARGDGILETDPGVGGWQRFSDRQTFAGPADRLGLRLVPGAPSQIGFILLSWGNGVNTGTPELCKDNLMAGTIGADTAFSIAFRSSH